MSETWLWAFDMNRGLRSSTLCWPKFSPELLPNETFALTCTFCWVVPTPSRQFKFSNAKPIHTRWEVMRCTGLVAIPNQYIIDRFDSIAIIS